MCKIDDQCKFDAWSRALKVGALGKPRGIGWGGRWQGDSWWGVMCDPVADPCQYVAGATTALWSDCPPKKKSLEGVVFYVFLQDNQTINYNKYCSQLDQLKGSFNKSIQN